MVQFCSWPVDYSTCGPCESLRNAEPKDQAFFEEMAGEYLWRWTGQRFGTCSVTLRPCQQNCTEGVSTYGSSGRRWTPSLVGGEWYNLSCGGRCRDSCGCSDESVLVFDRPVAAITTIEIDGQTLDPNAYRIDDDTILIRQDGGQWPQCQNLGAPLGSPGTWAIHAEFGTPVPVGGRLAAGKLACELAKAACSDKGCELPQRWQTITRQGVTISAAIDLFEGLNEGKTGIWLIDSWVASVTKPDIGFSIATPDYRRFGRRTTWTP